MTDDIKALVAKLREKPSYWHQPTYEFLHRDAADAIEKLEAENSYLRGEREHGAWDTLKAKWKAAEQERDHLKTQKDILWQGLNEAKTHIEKAEQERDDARSANGDLLNRINQLAQERDAYAGLIAEALALHGPWKIWESDRSYSLGCRHCITSPHPCPTHRALSASPADILAARDRRVAAEALRSASSLTTDDDYVFRSTDDVRDWLRVRADQIENGEEAHRG